MKQCVKIKISGKVQGVSYRHFVQEKALKFSIEGTVQNAEDKSVVIIHACGSSDTLDDFIDLLYKGPSQAKVTDVEVEPFINEKDFRGTFRIIGD